MKPATPLTESQKKYILENYRTKTNVEMAFEFGLESVFKVQQYCNQNGLKRDPNPLTEEQKQYIRDNYLSVKESVLSKETGLPVHVIQKFKSEEKLYRYFGKKNSCKPRKIEASTMFNVDDREDWIM